MPGPCGTSSRCAATSAADAEIRKVALAMLKILKAESPNLFGDYEIVDLPDGGPGGDDAASEGLRSIVGGVVAANPEWTAAKRTIRLIPTPRR